MSKPIPPHQLNTDSGVYSGATQPMHRVLQAISKVPEITVYFWIIKLLSTAMGESTSDYLVYQINPYVAVALGCLGLAVALILQLVVRRYVPWVYWLAVVMVAVFGTLCICSRHYLRDLVRQRENVVHPYDLPWSSRAVLLGYGHSYVCTWHRCRRSDRVNPPLRVLSLICPLCDIVRSPSSGLLVVWSERDRGLLVCLHYDPAARRFVCRLVGETVSGWSRAE
jgi:hypothetical protein